MSRGDELGEHRAERDASSLRARPGATVATPLDWAELGRSRPGGHTAAAIAGRLAQKPDPWSDMDEQQAHRPPPESDFTISNARHADAADPNVS